MRHQQNFNPSLSTSNFHPSSEKSGLWRRFIPALGLAFLALRVVPAQADDQIRAVRLSNVVGSVQILSGTETQFAQAYPNMPLMQGSVLKTGEDGRAEIQFEDGSVVRLTPNSSAAMGQLNRDSAGNTNTEVDLLTGLSFVEMRSVANQRFVVHFGGTEVISPAPVTFRVNMDASPVEMAVLDGSAHVSGGTAYSLDVHMNETVRFDAGDEGRYFLAQGVEADSWDQWNADRDQAMSQMAARETREARGSANPNDPGWNDLDYYGNWYASGDGGSFWAPDGAGAGWDPYGSGYWGNYGGAAGYVWISGYPWGWLPYHCGNWNYYNSFNTWGWTPGGCGSFWYPGGGIGYAPPRYRRLPRPNPIGHPGGPILHSTLIAVNRGPEATTLTPRTGISARSTMVNSGLRVLPKTQNPGLPGSFGRPNPPNGGVRVQGFNGTAQPGNMPVYRPSTPVSVYSPVARPVGQPPAFRPSGPTFSGGGRPSGGGAMAPAPRFSAPSTPAPSGGGGAVHAGGGGGGGGHVH
jgi:ferric-dicitrate binding protein FerR (iron transport regulator)